ncbi:hypothetical protein BDR26DRAFT_857051 [Obelidium mucronatum]|nr:hypothetical protein BDR26DRAFT_857051 [Obelidium mucronatum]
MNGLSHSPIPQLTDDEWAFSFSLLWRCSGLGVFSLGVSTQCPTCLPLKTRIFVFSLFLFGSLCIKSGVKLMYFVSVVGLPRCQPFTSATSIETDAQNDENRMMKGLSLSLWLLVCCSVCNIAILRNCRDVTHTLSLLNTSMHQLHTKTMLELQIKSR